MCLKHEGWSKENKKVGQKFLGFLKEVSHYAKHSQSSSRFPLHGREPNRALSFSAFLLDGGSGC